MPQPGMGGPFPQQSIDNDNSCPLLAFVDTFKEIYKPTLTATELK